MWVGVLLCLTIYIFAIMAQSVFHDKDPENFGLFHPCHVAVLEMVLPATRYSCEMYGSALSDIDPGQLERHGV